MKRRGDYRKGKTKENLLTDQEVEKILHACIAFSETFVLTALLFTGMRVSELIHMRKSWVDKILGLIRIPKNQACSCSQCERELRNKKDEITKPSGLWKPKTFEAVRSIPIVEEVQPVLDKFFSTHKTVMEYVPSRGSAYYYVRKVARRAKVQHLVFPHVMRGTFATLLARKGFNAFEIKDTMGWKSIKTAEEYIKLSGAAVKKAFEEKW